MKQLLASRMHISKPQDGLSHRPEFAELCLSEFAFFIKISAILVSSGEKAEFKSFFTNKPDYSFRACLLLAL
jgi:hypothetical protein